MVSATLTLPPFPVARFSVDQYHRMIESGAFTENDRIELIEGWVVNQMAKGPGHEYATGQMDQLLRELAPTGFHVRNQAPITLATSEPEPDVSVVRGDRALYRARHPGPSEVVLVVEVSDSSLATDRLKAKTYGAAGIAHYWLVNLAERCVEVASAPSASAEGGYSTIEIIRDGELELVIDGTRHGGIPLASIWP